MKTVKRYVFGHKAVTDMFNGKTLSSDLSDIERSFFIPSITIGSLFNAQSESVVEQLDVDIKPKKIKSNEQASVIMYKCKNIQQEQLLNILKMDLDTRLSATLKVVNLSGILSILNYCYVINELTRIIHYVDVIEEEFINYDFKERKHPSATHIVTKIKSGISLVIIIQLSPQDSTSVKKVDNILEHFTNHLADTTDIKNLISNQDQLERNISRIKVYSNVNDLSRLQNLCEVHQRIHSIRQNATEWYPISFILSSIPHSDSTNHIYFPINPKYISHIEKSIIPLMMSVNIFGKENKQLKSSLLKDHLQDGLQQADKTLKEFENTYSTYVNKLKTLLIEVRSGKESQENLISLLDNNEYRLLSEKRDQIEEDFKKLKGKNELINDLINNKAIEYLNVFTTDVKQADDQKSIEEKLIQNDLKCRIFCANDQLKHDDKDRWNELLNDLLNYRKEKPDVRLIYADFSYSSYELDELRIIYPKTSKKKKKVIGSGKPATDEISSKEDSNETPHKPESVINLVLFGESGVGKSTFINAFANYLLFDKIDDARCQEPIVVIPVSFVMTINDQFDERLIKFGHIHPNENHNDIGQSVTQHCKSYQWSIRNEKTVQIIDTPGFGDTRGQKQDETNFQEILTYLGTLSHLNALCILLKPNVKQLNPLFKSFLRQILQFFGHSFYKNVFFCFTSCQSTFFTIGDTGPVLRKFLQTDIGNDLCLNKENTFCFDSESFRYLVASQNPEIKFDEHLIEQFEKSWIMSVEQSKRLIDQICSRETQINSNHKWISIEHIKQEINHLIRPILETIRNISRNMILNQERIHYGIIELHPIRISSSIVVCYKAERPFEKFGEIFIMSDCLHSSSDQCQYEHLSTNYKLNYQFDETKKDYSLEDANTDLYRIIKACAHFDYILNDYGKINDKGPFLSGFVRMADEEKSISKQEESAQLNRKISSRIMKLKEQYEKDFQDIKSDKEHLFLGKILSRIDGLKQFPMIYQQIHLNEEPKD